MPTPVIHVRDLTLQELLAHARSNCIVGRPLIELAPGDLRIDDKRRVFIDFEALVRHILEQTQ